MSAFFRQAEINLRQLFNDFQCHGHPDSTIGKNYIINPAFTINQRGFAGGAGSGYGYDRWLVGGAGASMSLVDSNGFVSLLIAGASAACQHRVEAGTVPEGTVMTASWEGTAQGDEFNSSGEGFNNYRGSPFTFTTVAGVGIVDTIAVLGFNSGTLKNLKLEIGPIATQFEYPDPATDLIKCQRYFERAGVASGAFANIMTMTETSVTALEGVLFFSSKRTKEQTLSHSALFQYFNGAAQDVTISFSGSNTSTTAKVVGVGTGLSAGRAGQLQFKDTISYIDIDAEL